MIILSTIFFAKKSLKARGGFEMKFSGILISESITFFYFVDFLHFFHFRDFLEFFIISGIFRDRDRRLFEENSMEFKIPGIGLFRSFGFPTKKATSGLKGVICQKMF